MKLLMKFLLFLLITFSTLNASNNKKFLNDISSNKWFVLEKDTIEKYLDLPDNFFDYHSLKNISIIDTINNYYIIKLEVECGAGGFCEFDNLFITDNKGAIKDNLEWFNKRMGDLGFTSEYKGFYYKGGYIRIIQTEEEYGGELGDSTISSEVDTSNYVVFNGKFKSLRINYNYLESSQFVDLNNKSKNELRLLKNEIFARNGHYFTSQDLKDYFMKQPWYFGVPGLIISKEMLTKKEIAMLERIMMLEKDLKN